jgi:plastocyanin
MVTTTAMYAWRERLRGGCNGCSAPCIAVLLLLAGAAGNAGLGAQTLERSMLVGAPEAGSPWNLDVVPQFRFARATGSGNLQLRTTFDLALGLPARLLAGARFTPESQTVAGRPEEWEAYGRWAPLATDGGAPVDAAMQLAVNGAARSADGEAMVARRFGGVRLLAAGRVLSNAWDTGRTRGAVAAGVVIHPRPRHMPVSASFDAVTLLDRAAAAGERVAWSAALNVGVSFTSHTLSVFATNTPSASLQGSSRGDHRTRIGLTFTAPIAIGRLLGLVTSREVAQLAVAEGVPATEGMVRADIIGYRYAPSRLVVSRGTTVEWTNRDAMVHTVTADDGSWNSGGMRPGATWRARFDEPGIYPYYCGPHPFMKAVVVVH